MPGTDTVCSLCRERFAREIRYRRHSMRLCIDCGTAYRQGIRDGAGIEAGFEAEILKVVNDMRDHGPFPPGSLVTMQGVEAERGVVREVLRSYPLGDTWMVEVEGWEPLGCGWFKAAKAKSRRAPHAGH